MIVRAVAKAFSETVFSTPPLASNQMLLATSMEKSMAALAEMNLTAVENAYLGFCLANSYLYYQNTLVKRKKSVFDYFFPK